MSTVNAPNTFVSYSYGDGIGADYDDNLDNLIGVGEDSENFRVKLSVNVKRGGETIQVNTGQVYFRTREEASDYALAHGWLQHFWETSAFYDLIKYFIMQYDFDEARTIYERDYPTSPYTWDEILEKVGVGAE